MSESDEYLVPEEISGQKRKRKNSKDEKDAAELKRESSSGSDESATGEDREDKETDFSIPLAAKKRKEEETSLAKEEGKGMGGGERDDIESSQEVSEAEWVLIDKPAEDDKSLKLSTNTRQDSLAKLTFAFQRPAEKQNKLTSISTQLGKLIPHYFIAQGYPMKANFNWKKESLKVDILSNVVVTPPKLKWPIYMSFGIELQNCKEQSWEIKGACEKGGKCGSLEIPTTDIEGYADVDSRLHFDIYSLE